MSRRAPFEGHVSRTHAYCHGHRVAGRARAVARRSSRRAAHADAVSREAKGEKRDRNPLSSSITAAGAGATTESLRPRPLKRCWTCAMAPRAVESTEYGRQVEDQVRVVRSGRLVELRGQRIDRIEVQLPLGGDDDGLGASSPTPRPPRAALFGAPTIPPTLHRRGPLVAVTVGRDLPPATVLVAVGAPVGEPEGPPGGQRDDAQTAVRCSPEESRVRSSEFWSPGR